MEMQETEILQDVFKLKQNKKKRGAVHICAPSLFF